jgi:hypothetical protein
VIFNIHEIKKWLSWTNKRIDAQQKQEILTYASFRFLLSKGWSDWNEVFSEAKSRLNVNMVYWIVVLLMKNEKEDYKRIENLHFSGLYVDKK